MNQNQVASLSLKLLGIYSIIEAIPILRELSTVFAWRGSKIEMIDGPMQANILFIGIVISVGLLLLVGLCLILFSGSLSRLITTKDEKIMETTLTARNIQSIAFSVVGLVMVVIAIPHIVQFSANAMALKHAGSESVKRDISIGNWSYSLGISAQFIIGLLLFFGGRGLSSIWYFFQKLRPMKDL